MALNTNSFPEKILVVLGSNFGHGTGVYGLKEDDVVVLKRASITTQFARYTEDGTLVAKSESAPGVPNLANRLQFTMASSNIGTSTQENMYLAVGGSSWGVAPGSAAADGWTGFSTAADWPQISRTSAGSRQYDFLTNFNDAIIGDSVKGKVFKSITPYVLTGGLSSNETLVPEFSPAKLTTFNPDSADILQYEISRLDTQANTSKVYNVGDAVPNETLEYINSELMRVHLHAGRYRFRVYRSDVGGRGEHGWSDWSDDVFIPAGTLGQSTRRRVIVTRRSTGAVIATVDTASGFEAVEIPTTTGSTVFSTVDQDKRTGRKTADNVVVCNEKEIKRGNKVYVFNHDIA